MNRIAKERPPTAPRRKASRELRRHQLIEATIETLARRGYAQTTMTDVANTAGVSHGLVNFHFDTKEKLLTETLLFLAEEYRVNWTTALAEAPADPASQLDALVRADYNDVVCTPSKLVAWCAYWGEAQSRPIYQEKCGANDLAYNRNLEKIIGRLIKAGGYAHRARRVARVLRATSEGIWLDLQSTKQPYSRAEALLTMFTCVAAFFPRHFDEGGIRRTAGK